MDTLESTISSVLQNVTLEDNIYIGNREQPLSSHLHATIKCAHDNLAKTANSFLSGGGGHLLSDTVNLIELNASLFNNLHIVLEELKLIDNIQLLLIKRNQMKLELDSLKIQLHQLF